MPITYTNRKGFTYTLCRGTTKTGKPRYTFSREPKDEPVEQIPEGYAISESVNGIVSLSKERPNQLRSEEVEAVNAVLARHPLKRKYRIGLKPNRIDIYELVGPGSQDIGAMLKKNGLLGAYTPEHLRASIDDYARFTPVMRFTLIDAEHRTFGAERMCYLGSIDDWIDIDAGTLHVLAKRLIPKLGTEQFFELF
jgi:hypothetical protein